MTLRRTKISWADYSGGPLNFIIGCTPISAGCKNCYAQAWAKRAGREFSKVRIYPDKLDRLAKAQWEPGDKPYRRRGRRPIMFPCDLSDLFHPEVPDDFIYWTLLLMMARHDADWVLLTKRPRRMLDVTARWLNREQLEQLPDNIWCLVTAENQARLDERTPILQQVKAQVRGMSLEPMLGPIDLTRVLANNSLYKAEQYAGRFRFHGEQQEDGSIIAICNDGTTFYDGVDLHWVIVGAESGPDRRPFEVAWAKDVYKQCAAAGVPFFGKQDSGLYPGVPLMLPKYGEVKEWPR